MKRAARLSIEDVIYARELWRRGADDFDVTLALGRQDLGAVRTMLVGLTYRHAPCPITEEERRSRRRQRTVAA